MVQTEPGEVAHDQRVPFLSEFSKAHAGEPVAVRVSPTAGSEPIAGVRVDAVGVTHRRSSDDRAYSVPVRHAAPPALPVPAAAAVVRFIAHPVAPPTDA